MEPDRQAKYPQMFVLDNLSEILKQVRIRNHGYRGTELLTGRVRVIFGFVAPVHRGSEI